jgi:uncharacterized membrane protein YagU involved in acid resistance
MTAAMLALHRYLPRERAMEPAPVEVTRGVARLEPEAYEIVREHIGLASIVAHFSYGAATGAIYKLLASGRTRDPVASGMTWGMLVWAGSYLGYLPVLGIRRPATEDPWQRNVTMIAAHLVWGSALGLLARR